MDTVQCSYALGYYTAATMNVTLLHTDDSHKQVLSRKSQTHNNPTHVIPFISSSETGKTGLPC